MYLPHPLVTLKVRPVTVDSDFVLYVATYISHLENSKL